MTTKHCENCYNYRCLLWFPNLTSTAWASVFGHEVCQWIQNTYYSASDQLFGHYITLHSMLLQNSVINSWNAFVSTVCYSTHVWLQSSPLISKGIILGPTCILSWHHCITSAVELHISNSWNGSCLHSMLKYPHITHAAMQ